MTLLTQKMICLVLLSWITISGTIALKYSAAGNSSITGTLIDGDIMIEDHEDIWDRHYGPLINMKEKRWPSGVVPYNFNESVYTLWDLFMIREAFKEIEKDTCVRFVRKTDEKDYIYITPVGGCWSFIGRKGADQVLSLLVPNCINKGTIIHELLHTLGLWHEHSRSDRDDYVEILWQNVVNEEKQVNFAKYLPEDLNVHHLPYDYMSVMHYDAYTFSKSPKLPTMKPKNPDVRLRDLGRAKVIGTLTDIDKQKINLLYECESD